MAAPTPVYKFCSSLIQEALTQTRGSMGAAARYVSEQMGELCTRGYIKDAVAKRPELAEHYAAIRDAIVDQAEANIFAAVDAGDVRVSQMVVSTLGRDRGWATRTEVDVHDHAGTIERIQEARKRAKMEKEGGAEADPATVENWPPARGRSAPPPEVPHE